MYASVGDRLVIPSDSVEISDSAGAVVEARHPDGRPPYWVRWDRDGHESLVFPPDKAFVIHRSLKRTG